MKILLTGIALCFMIISQAQHTFKAIIKSEEHSLAGATVRWKEQNKLFRADSTGTITINNIPDGRQTFIFSYTGFQEQEISYTFPLSSNDIIQIILEANEEEEEEVIVTATRTSRTISNTPTRTEVISGEELEEKANMKPGEIRMLLNESTGIQMQQTSATSFNSSIRIQGLDGRYTQVLKDGYPLYAGFSGGLSLMQVVPLDLKQVEVIKGASSTLYGGGAIAGLVNLVSKVPGEKRELNFLANTTSARGLDLSGFYSQKFNKAGVTVFASRNTGYPYDPADIGLTAIPKFERYTINPRLFLYGARTNFNAGFSYITEDRVGGSLAYIKNNQPGYFEKNNTDRFTTQAGIDHKLGEHAQLHFKNSYSHFKRSIFVPSYEFAGTQQSSFSELTYNYEKDKVQWVAGANLWTDDFTEDRQSALIRDYHYNTFGLFMQNAWQVSEVFTLESGIRGDYVKQYGLELLPRVSALFKITPKLTVRAGGGMGYKTPTIFTEESERIQFRDVLPLNESTIKNERSVGGNIDLNYRTNIGQVGLSINQLFFYTRLNKPLIMLFNSSGDLEFRNADGHIDTRGIETNVKLTYHDFKLFIGYTFADVNTHFNDVRSRLPLTARHRLNNVLVYEVEQKLKLGLEAYYFSPQKLNDNSMGRSYWIMGFMAEKLWKRFSIFINFENFTDSRQTKFESIYTGPIDNPVFKDIYAPLDGFVVNGGVKLKL
ncbi:MAG: TonB-dependent receptor [Chitinophagaceae bacterium]